MFTEPLVIAIITASGVILAQIATQTFAYLYNRKKKIPEGHIALDPKLALAHKARNLITQIQNENLELVSSEFDEKKQLLKSKEDLVKVLKKELDKCQQRVDHLIRGNK